jgi:hypothetical protein
MKMPCFLLAGLTASSLTAAEITPLHKLHKAALEERLVANAGEVQSYRAGLRAVIEFMGTRPDLFPTNSTSGRSGDKSNTNGDLRREEKEAVWALWQRFLDYQLALESLAQYHERFDRLKEPAREDSFLIGDAAVLARYRFALEFIERAERNPDLHKILNDAVPELGMPSGTYSKLKLEFLSVGIATQFGAREVLLKTFNGDREPALRAAIKSDADYIWKASRWRGPSLTAKNALKVVLDAGQTGWLPIQKGVSEWMGHTKVYRSGETLISPSQIRELQPKLLPGDVLLERREWYLSNIGLPGFWSHAALYIGTSAERKSYFGDAATREWVRGQGESSGDFETLLQARQPAAYELAQASQSDNGDLHQVRIIEAIGEGVSFKTLEHSAACDSLVVLRPLLPKVEKAQALLRAFHYSGRPYDFDFDFATDSKLVCTELVYKSYEPGTAYTGLKFPMVEMLGRKVTPANELIKQLDTQFDTPARQYDVVVFLDGQERKKKAVESSVAELRRTWQRPKWHVLAQP